jgi:hypothetical protein
MSTVRKISAAYSLEQFALGLAYAVDPKASDKQGRRTTRKEREEKNTRYTKRNKRRGVRQASLSRRQVNVPTE